MSPLIGHIVLASPRLRVLAALRHRDFRWLWAANLVQAAGIGMQFLVLGWLVLELTDSSSQLGLVIFLYGVPNLALLIFGGIFADRIDRRWLLLSTLVIVATVLLVIATVTIAGLVEMWHIYVTVFILGMMQGLNMPARLAMVSDLVDREDIMNAVALNSAVTHAGRIVGAPVAGGIIELADVGTALYLNAGCYLVGIAFLLGIRRVPLLRQARATTVVRDLSEGFRYFWETPVPFSLIGMGLAFGFFAGAYIQVLPAFAKEVLGVGAGGAGALIAGAALGALAGSFALASLGDFHHKNRLLVDRQR